MVLIDSYRLKYTVLAAEGFNLLRTFKHEFQNGHGIGSTTKLYRSSFGAQATRWQSRRLGICYSSDYTEVAQNLRQGRLYEPFHTSRSRSLITVFLPSDS